MFTFIFEHGSKPEHILQAKDKKEALEKLTKVMNLNYKASWDAIGQSIRVIETKYLGIKLHIGEIEGVEI